jgi:hypothetical protein
MKKIKRKIWKRKREVGITMDFVPAENTVWICSVLLAMAVFLWHRRLQKNKINFLYLLPGNF